MPVAEPPLLIVKVGCYPYIWKDVQNSRIKTPGAIHTCPGSGLRKHGVDLVHVLPAIDRQGRSGYETGIVGNQQSHQVKAPCNEGYKERRQIS